VPRLHGVPQAGSLVTTPTPYRSARRLPRVRRATPQASCWTLFRTTSPKRGGRETRGLRAVAARQRVLTKCRSPLPRHRSTTSRFRPQGCTTQGHASPSACSASSPGGGSHAKMRTQARGRSNSYAPLLLMIPRWLPASYDQNVQSGGLDLFDNQHRRLVSIVVTLPDHDQPPSAHVHF
jgi:hypothetical protein